MWDTLSLVGFKVVCGLSVHLSRHVSRKRLVVEQNGLKFGTRGYW